MDVLTIASIFGAAVAAILMRLGASELSDWLPTIARRILDRAICKLSLTDQDRYREEWYAHLNECPGKLGKYFHAIGCLLSANRLARIRAGSAKSRGLVSQIFELGLMRLHLRLIETINSRVDRLNKSIDDFRQQVSQEIGVLIEIDTDQKYAMIETKIPEIWTIRFVLSDYLTSSSRLARLERRMIKVRREYASFKVGSSTPASLPPGPRSPSQPT